MQIEELKLPAAHLPFDPREGGLANVLLPFLCPETLEGGIGYGRSCTAGDSEGAAWVDFNNDGRLDVFVSCDDNANQLYRNDGNGAFTKITNAIMWVD